MKVDLKNIFLFLKNFRFNSIFIRNFILIALVIMLPLLTMGIILYVHTQKSIDLETSLITTENASTIKNSIDNIINTTNTLAIQTSLNQNVQSLCLTAYKDDKTISNIHQNLTQYISNYTNVFPYIDSIYIYSEKTQTIIDNKEIMKFEDHLDTNWFKFYKNSLPNESTVVHRKKYNSYPSYISIIRCVELENFKKIGCIVININIEQLIKVIRDIEGISINEAIIFDENGYILLCKDITQIGTHIEEYTSDAASETILSQNNGHVMIGDVDYLFGKTVSSRYNFSYLTLIPRTHFNNIIVDSIKYLALLFLLLLLFGLVFAIYVSFKTYSPIQRILTFLLPNQSFEDISFEQQNEISYIMDTIESTLDKNTKLVEELNYRMLLLTQAQVYALQSQINPHFLNNTLENMNWTAINQLGENNTISQTIKYLSALFDISLDTEHYLIPIEEELQHTNIFVYISSLNYGSDLQFAWDIKENVTKYNILKFSLQPIIENAIVHGISPKKGKGEIKIQADFHEDGILFTISDNGIGIDEAELAKLQNDLSSNSLKGKNIGIQNVNQRIKLIFGEKYGVSISSKKGVGTTVNIYIPKTQF